MRSRPLAWRALIREAARSWSLFEPFDSMSTSAGHSDCGMSEPERYSFSTACRVSPGFSRAFRLNPGDTLQAVENEYLSGALIPQSEWPALVDMLSNGSKSDQERAASLISARQASGRDRIECYLDIFCRQDRGARKDIVTKGLADKFPQWGARLRDE